MRGRWGLLAVAVLAGLTAAQPAAPSARTSGVVWVRAAVPALEAYWADHGTYRGATAPILRRQYDSALKNVRILRAAKESYCIESTSGSPPAFKNGPGADILIGRCRAPAKGRPLPGPPPAPSPTSAAGWVQAAVPAIEAYGQDHSGYLGMTFAKLRSQYDSSLRHLRVVRATRASYCVDSTFAGGSAHMAGPGAANTAGLCA